MLEHLKLFDPRRAADPKATAMWWGIFFATVLWVLALLVILSLG